MGLKPSNFLCLWDFSGFHPLLLTHPASCTQLTPVNPGRGGKGSQSGLQMNRTEEWTLCPSLHSPYTWPCMKICVCAVT